MKMTKCDKHPDRDAVVTLYIYKFSPGFRPLFPIIHSASIAKPLDLCEECASSISEEFVNA